MNVCAHIYIHTYMHTEFLVIFLSIKEYVSDHRCKIQYSCQLRIFVTVTLHLIGINIVYKYTYV